VFPEEIHELGKSGLYQGTLTMLWYRKNIQKASQIFFALIKAKDRTVFRPSHIEMMIWNPRL